MGSGRRRQVWASAAGVRAAGEGRPIWTVMGWGLRGRPPRPATVLPPHATSPPSPSVTPCPSPSFTSFTSRFPSLHSDLSHAFPPSFIALSLSPCSLPSSSPQLPPPQPWLPDWARGCWERWWVGVRGIRWVVGGGWWVVSSPSTPTHAQVTHAPCRRVMYT